MTADEFRKIIEEEVEKTGKSKEKVTQIFLELFTLVEYYIEGEPLDLIFERMVELSKELKN